MFGFKFQKGGCLFCMKVVQKLPAPASDDSAISNNMNKSFLHFFHAAFQRHQNRWSLKTGLAVIASIVSDVPD